MNNEIIRTEKITKIFDLAKIEVRALNGVSLTVQKGEFTSIVGPSGSGKTTLLNILGGLDKPSAGKIFIDGNDITSLSDNEMIDFRLRNIGFVFQAYNLIPVLSAIENVEFIMLLQNRPKQERESRAIALLKAVGLESRINNKPTELSGGQQQRVAVARALASKPRFILADEPTANLDSSSAVNLLDIMRKLNREENTTFLFSTHDPRVIERATRVITLQDGVVISDDLKNRNQ